MHGLERSGNCQTRARMGRLYADWDAFLNREYPPSCFFLNNDAGTRVLVDLKKEYRCLRISYTALHPIMGDFKKHIKRSQCLNTFDFMIAEM